jgi:hypothetical protein
MSQQYWTDALNIAKEQLETLRLRLDALDAEREEAVSQIVQMEQLVKSLTSLTSENPLEKINATLVENANELSLADACREVLVKNTRYMTPIEIRDTLAASGFDLSTYSNPLASIHGVLKRIAESGSAEKHEKGGTTLYKWNLQRNEARTSATTSGVTGMSGVGQIVEMMSRREKTIAEKLFEQTHPPKNAMQEMIDAIKGKK